MTGLGTTLAEVVERLDDYDDGMTIWARARADLTDLTGDCLVVVEAEPEDGVSGMQARGLSYVLEVHLAKHVIAVWRQWHPGMEPSVARRCEAVIHYATHDAYLDLLSDAHAANGATMAWLAAGSRLVERTPADQAAGQLEQSGVQVGASFPAGRRWTIEERLQPNKSLIGLDQHQVHRWRCGYRRVTLPMLAHAFLVVAAVTEQAKNNRLSPPSGTIGTGLSGTIGRFMRRMGSAGICCSSASQAYRSLSGFVVGRRGTGGPASEQVAYERLQVSAGRGLDRRAHGAQEGVDLAETDQVGSDGALGAILGAQCRSNERISGLSAAWSMTRAGNKVRGLHPVHGPPDPASKMKTTSVSAGQGCVWPART